MRELSKMEVAVIGGGSAQVQINCKPVFDTSLFKQLRAEIQKEMQQVVIEMHSNPFAFSWS